MTSIYFKKEPKVEEIDSDIEIIEEKDMKPKLKKEIEVIDVCETQEMVLERSHLNDSPINVPKKKNKRVFDDSEDEDKQWNHKKQNTASDANDETGKMAFEEMCEQAIKELMDLFPEVDVCEIQDALIESDWSVFNASIKIGNLSNLNPEEENGVTQSKPTINGVNDTTNPRIVTSNDDKMKSFDYYRRKWKPNQSSDDILNQSLIPSSSNKFNSIKNNQKKFRRTNRKDEDEEEDYDDSEEEYDRNDEQVICGSSDDEDSADDSKGFKEKSTKSIIIRTQDLKEKVVKFLQVSNELELETIPGVSRKKVEIILNLRPFLDWNDVFVKFNASNLSTELLDSCSEVLKARNVVERLMNACEDISKDLTETVERLRPLEQPKILNPEMKLSNYQLIGLNWLALMYKKNINCILADEMGLGKTIQVIALFAFLRETRNLKGPHLVIVPSSTLDNWMREFQIWCKRIKLLLYYGSQEERAEIREQISRSEIDFDVIITTYNMAHSPGDKNLFKRSKFNYVVFDEAHFLKNMKTSRFASLMNLNAKHRLLLTGTPLQNNLVELMSLLIFTMPHMFKGKTDQIKTLFTYNNKDSVHRISYINDRIAQAKKIMKPFVLRRLKIDVLQDLPLKIDHICICPMSDTQELKYMELIENYTREIKYKKITFEDSESEEKYQRGTGMLMNLRKLANHPMLMRLYYDDSKLRQMSKLMLKEETHKEANPQLIFEDMQVMHDFELYNLCKRYKSLHSFKMDTEFIFDSGKFNELDSLLTRFRIDGKRVLLFSQFTIMLDIIEEYMNLKYYKYLRLDGQTRVCDRMDYIDKFNNDNDIFVFLLSTRAGGLGINLTAASVVIIHDIDFNPYNDKQAEDRCHRIGQTKEVIVYRLISQSSIEEGMLKIAEEKLKLGRDISSNEGDEKEEQIEKTDVKTLLRAALKL